MIPEAWKLIVPCSREQMAGLEARLEALGDMLEQPPTITLSELGPDDWQVEAYFLEPPELPPDLAGFGLEPVYPDDWVRLSQQSLKPIRAGRFHVYSEATRASLPVGKIGLRIEAGPAFGTGQHATTTGCLRALDRLAKRYKAVNALDLGTGTAILAMAIARRFGASVIASDIDAPSIVFARVLLAANRFSLGASRRRSTIEPVVAAGMAHRRLMARAPYDMIAANILAGPLIALAPALVAALKPGGLLILAGLLDTQEQAVRQRYLSLGLVKQFVVRTGEWPTLVLRKRARAVQVQ
jgi:ribosomal protein L11 methyltransferase